jgi:hypothetical protein
MGFITSVLEAIAVLVPDFEVLGLGTPVFFSLYCCAIALGLPTPKSLSAGLLVSLLLGYAFAVALNIVRLLWSPFTSRAATSTRTTQESQSKGSPEQCFRTARDNGRARNVVVRPPCVRYPEERRATVDSGPR